jgi:hypothetical protein
MRLKIPNVDAFFAPRVGVSEIQEGYLFAAIKRLILTGTVVGRRSDGRQQRDLL